MTLLAAGLAGRTEPDGGLAGNQRGLARGARLLERVCDRTRIVPVNTRGGPAGRLEALHLVDRIRKRERTVDRDAVVVEQHDELVELEMPSKRDRLLADALHEVAVGGEYVRVVIDELATELGCEMSLGD